MRNASNLTSGGWFDKLDPYAIVRFRGSKEARKTARVLEFRDVPRMSSFHPNFFDMLHVVITDYCIKTHEGTDYRN